MTRNGETDETRPTERRMWGTLARLAVGAILLAVAFVVGVGWDDAAIGLVGFPAAVMLVPAIRGRSATPLRLLVAFRVGQTANAVTLKTAMQGRACRGESWPARHKGSHQVAVACACERR